MAVDHLWVDSTLGHGEKMCSRCYITNREADALGAHECEVVAYTESRADSWTEIERLRSIIRDAAEALERGSTAAPVLELLRSAYDTSVPSKLDLVRRENDMLWDHIAQIYLAQKTDTPNEMPPRLVRP